MSTGSLCSGYEGFGLALKETPAWVTDNDPDAARLLAHRFPDVPNLGDITTVDWQDVEPVDVLTAGYPCQPFSHAGKRKGSDDSRHIWPSVARAIGVLRPRRVLLENVAGHVSLGLADVLADLAALGYDATWGVVRAAAAGAPHGRARVFILATDSRHQPGRAMCGGQPGRQDATERLAESDHPSAADARSGPFAGVAATGDGLPVVAECGRVAAADTDSPGLQGLEKYDCCETPRLNGEVRGHTDRRSDDIDWGAYTAAVRRWEAVLRRHAPRPTESGRTGERLAPRFVEWMQGLPEGWVCDVPGLSRNAQLRLLGNGIVPQQARLALDVLTALGAAA